MKVLTDIDIPADTLIYDIAAKKLVCRICSGWRQLAPDATFPTVLNPHGTVGVSADQLFMDFAGAHVACIIRDAAEKKRHADLINETRGGPGDR